MSLEERDPLLEKLRALPSPTLNTARSTQTLSAAEAALPGRSQTRWPEIAIAVTLAVTGAMYVVGSVNKLGEIYGSHEVATVDSDR